MSRILDLPFNRWTLRFYHSSYEKAYDESQQKKRLICFRILTSAISILALIFLIVFLAQNQPIILPVMMGTATLVSFILLIISDKLQIYLKYGYSIIYVVLLAASVFISYQGLEIPLYPYAFGISQVLLLALQCCGNHIKIIYILGTPFFIMGMFNIYMSNNFHWLFVIFTCSFVSGIFIHVNEYNSRLAFSLSVIVTKQREVINKFVTESLFLIGLDDRTQQFKLEFKNQHFENNYKIKDTQDMKDFLREHSVKKESKLEKKQNYQETQTLEEYLFRFISSASQNSNKMQQEQIIECYSSFNLEEKLFLAKIEYVNYCKPLLIVCIQNKIITNQNEELLTKLESFKLISLTSYKEILNMIKIARLKIQQNKQIFYNHPERFQFQLIQIANLVRNYQIYFQKENVHSKRFNKVTQFRFNEFILQIQQYLQYIGSQKNKQFTLLNYVDESVFVTINFKYLTQILLNIYSTILRQECSNTIILTITTNNKIESLNHIEDDQLIIQFTFCYTSNKSQSYQSFNQLNLSTLDISQISMSVTQLLLEVIGPYNTIQCESRLLTPEPKSQLINEYTFFIYQDQSELGISYVAQHN